MSELLAWCGHPLLEHLKNVAGIASLEASKLEEAARRARGLGYELDVERLRREILSVANKIKSVLDCRGVNPLRAAAYGHDVGKALSTYQRNLKRDPSCKRVSLKGHEVWSAWAVYHAVVAAGAPKDCAAAVAAGAALHHSARRSLADLIAEPLPWPSMDDLKTLASLAAEAAGVGEAEVYVLLKRDYLAFTPLANLRERLVSESAVWGELLTYAVSIADNLDAFLNRSERIAAVLGPFLRRSTF